VDERDYNADRGLGHNLSRLMSAAAYPALEAAGRAAAYQDLGLKAPAALEREAAGVRALSYPDSFAYEKSRLELLRAAYPQESRYRALLARHRQGWYVSEGRILPLGDNRDNSRDGRYFGPVRISKILGKGLVIYWPPGRMGLIR
jgi:signal peptidase I